MKLVLCLAMLFVAAPVLAAEWQVERVRGEVTQMRAGTWHPVSRGELIDDDRLLRTGANGRIGLSRGAESIELEGNSQVRLVDAGGRMMTTVMQDFGTVSIDVERRNVQHFSVQTPFLAAVVKGTRFTVRTDAGSTIVDVDRGVVQVQDTVNDLVADVRPGQEATVGAAAPLLIEGAGAVSVYSFAGVPVVNGTTTEAASEADGNGRRQNSDLTDSGSDRAARGNSVQAAGNSSTSNAGGNGNASDNGRSSNAGGNGNGNSGSSNAGGNGNGNSGSSNDNGNGNGNANSAANEASDTKSNNAGGNGKGNANGLDKD